MGPTPGAGLPRRSAPGSEANRLHVERNDLIRPNRRAIARGLQWMDRHFSASENPVRLRDYYYYMYGVERVGLASGMKHFGGHDWYAEGAR